MGKSTLSSYLSYKRFNYITDDNILINKETYKIVPYTLPIRLREGGINILEKHIADIRSNIKVLPYGERFLFFPQNRCNEEL